MNRLIMAFALMLTLTACEGFAPYAGISYHDTSLDGPEIGLNSDLGIAGFEYQHKSWGDALMFCEHMSAISQTEQGGGLNHCGFKVRK